jgi:predicted SAM-dependent methyltransferase
MNLELAAGDRPTPGFIHHDARALDDIEIVCDIDAIGDHVADGSCGVVRATHFLEHFSHRKTVLYLKRWGKLLKTGGVLYIEVPNLMWQARALASDGKVNGPDGYHEWPHEELVRLMYGDQDYPGNAHYTGFTDQTLSTSLADAGFKDIAIADVGMVLCAHATWPGANFPE